MGPSNGYMANVSAVESLVDTSSMSPKTVLMTAQQLAHQDVVLDGYGGLGSAPSTANSAMPVFDGLGDTAPAPCPGVTGKGPRSPLDQLGDFMGLGTRA